MENIPLTLSLKSNPRISKIKRDSNPFLDRLDSFTFDRLKTPKYKLISLFCGGGGLDLGLGFAGFESLVVSDLVPAFVDTVTHNLPFAKGLSIDALKLTGSQLIELANTQSIDLVAAGPPCQAFSILGRRGALDDPRGKLALKYFELVKEISPKAFLFENVPGLLTVNKGLDWQRLIDFAIKVTGYNLHFTKLNAVNFGIPQFRERVIVVGFKENLKFSFPSSVVQTQSEFAPSLWALQRVNSLPNHDIRVHGERVRNRYSIIPQGARDSTDHTDRINSEKPSGTVLVGSSAGGGRPHIHPLEPRVITVREAARLQSFPDWYEFRGTGTSQYRQVGNAVPPLLAFEIGKSIRAALDQEKIDKTLNVSKPRLSKP